MALQVAAGLLFLLFAGAWLLDGTDTALRARAAEVAAALARPGTRLLVHGRPPEVVFGQQEPPALAPGQELAHLFAHGPRGAYLWQLADPDGASFDEGRYLVGSDGSQLWTWDPDLGTGRTLAVSAVPDPLPRTLARVLAELEEYTLLARGETRGRGPWREVEVALGSEAEDPTVRFLFTAEGVLVGLEFLPRPDLAVFVEPLPGSSSAPTPTASFALTTHAGPDPEAILALEAPPQPQPDVLWQLGYTPGAPPATWPEQLSALAQELGALGYL